MKTALPYCTALMFLACPALAQTGPGLMLVPWADGQDSQVGIDATYQNTEADGPGFDLDLTRIDSQARFRLNPESTYDPTLGLDYTYLNLSTSDPMLPSRLVDFSIALGGRLGETECCITDRTWSLGYSLGLGYAGSAPFNDGDAWYALGSLFAVQVIDQDTQWIVALDYDGNRSFLPDIPLPAISYLARYNDELTYALGFPYSSLTWTPQAHWNITLEIALFINITAKAEYQASDELTLFASYERSVDAFQLDNDNGSRRLLFSQDRLELGVNYALYENTTLTAACGYAFNQSFERGYDTRDTTTTRDLDDALYFRVGVVFGF